MFTKLINILYIYIYICIGFPGSSVVKESICNVGDVGLISGSGRSPGEGNSYPFQYSCLGNPKDREVWQATVLPGLQKSDTT